MNRLNPRDRAILVDLMGEALTIQDEAAVASAIDELREALPVFRREAARILVEEVAR